jgi:hypothetical protein
VKKEGKISKPPALAEKIIRVVNLLGGPGLDLIDRGKLYNELFMGFINAVLPNPFTSKQSIAGVETPDGLYANFACKAKALEVCLRGLPSEFVDYVGLENLLAAFPIDFTEDLDAFNRQLLSVPEYNAMDFFGRVSQANRRYDRARDWYRKLHRLANYLAVKEMLDSEWEWKLRCELEDLIGAEQLVIDDGVLEIIPDKFIVAFAKLPVERLRICTICESIFWARRSDSETCSTRCSKILRTRRWRKNLTPEQTLKYKINRIRKEIKKGEM